jgi:hypothetical protein
MKTVLGLLAIVAICGGFVAHRQRTTPTAPAAQVSARSANAPAPSASVSQHNWPKNSLDRAHDVKRQVLEQRKANGTH